MERERAIDTIENNVQIESGIENVLYAIYGLHGVREIYRNIVSIHVSVIKIMIMVCCNGCCGAIIVWVWLSKSRLEKLRKMC